MSADQASRVNSLPATVPITIDPSSSTSKKRARDQVSPDDDSMGGTLPPSRTPGISPDAIYGEGVARINPLTGLAPTVETQAGTWFEDQLEKKLKDKLVPMTDSDDELPKRKLPRRDPSSDAVIAMNATSTDSPKAAIAEPTIDQYTHMLGVGWTHVGEGSGLLAMARGYGRYIDNHYILNDSKVLLKSKSLDAYLVKADQGYFLFPESLLQARLVARTWEDTLANLQCSPVRFSPAKPLFSAETSDRGRSNDHDTDSSPMVVDRGDMELD